MIERYDGDPEQVARELVEAANVAGGTDNITAIFVAGSEFLGNASPAAAEARVRNAITKARDGVVGGVERGRAGQGRRGC